MQTSRVTAAAAGVWVAAWAARATAQIVEAIGAQGDGGVRAARLATSPAWTNGTFHNQHPLPGGPARSTGEMLRELIRPRANTYPTSPVPLVRRSPAPVMDGGEVTWLGHSTVLVQLDGARILIDPLWSERCSPSQRVGPRRIHPVPYPLHELPPIDAVVISHDHYDHLDTDSIKELAALRPDTRFVVPLGVGAHLERWGVPAGRIDELDWHEHTEVAGVGLIAAPAQHFSGRTLDRNRTLWASWAIRGATRSVFYSGDTGYTTEFAEIGRRYGPFDLALVQVGAYDAGWPGVHMTPEEGVRTALDVGAPVMVPVHWGTFRLAFHPWAEPVERAVAAARDHDVAIAVPRPGESVPVTSDQPEPTYWWRAAV